MSDIADRFAKTCAAWYKAGRQQPCWPARQMAYIELCARHTMPRIDRRTGRIRDIFDRIEGRAMEEADDESEKAPIQRAGVRFTEEQKEIIKLLAESDRELILQHTYDSETLLGATCRLREASEQLRQEVFDQIVEPIANIVLPDNPSALRRAWITVIVIVILAGVLITRMAGWL